jgi:protein-S-isoprenylcysteine O-methyltransferase Ste14
VSRVIVGGLFALFMLSTVLKAIEEGGRALADPSLRNWLVLGFWVLKIAVVGAFWWFIIARPESRRRAREPVAFAACAAAILGAVALQGPTQSTSTPLLVAGEALALLSCAWMLASVLTLGRCFGVLPEARGLVTRGPYRLVRHPVYLGELGACAGLVLGAPTARNLVAAAVLLAGQLVRMRLEEDALTREFPQYAAYAARTRRILPWPWPVPAPSTATAPRLGAH